MVFGLLHRVILWFHTKISKDNLPLSLRLKWRGLNGKLFPENPLILLFEISPGYYFRYHVPGFWLFKFLYSVFC